MRHSRLVGVRGLRLRLGLGLELGLGLGLVRHTRRHVLEERGKVD